MKDKVARDMIGRVEYVCGKFGGSGLKLDVASLRKRLADLEVELERVSIKDCPKCGHPVLVQKRDGAKIENSGYQWHGVTVYNYKPSYFQCLTCGSKFTCSDRCVCELVEEK